MAAGTAALQAGELDYAQSALTAAQKKAPSDPNVLSTLGRLARVQGRNKQAIEYMERAQAVTSARLAAENAGPLSVGLLDYGMPGATVRAAAGGLAVSDVPLIPNPLGARPAAEPITGRAPQNFSPMPTRVAPQPQPPAPVQQQPRSSALPQQQPTMRPVQYRPAARSNPVFMSPDSPSPAGAMAPLVTIPVQVEPAVAPSPLNDQGPVGQTRVDLPGRLLAPIGWPSAEAARPEDVRGQYPTPANSLQREIDELRAQRSSRLGFGAGWQGRSGQSGTSELSNISTVVEGRFAAGEAGQLVLRIEPVFLSAGSGAAPARRFPQFGTNALSDIKGINGTTRAQEDSGVALSIGCKPLV